ncbi:hypothetical protein L483_14440 [Pseudomonas putida H8234]|nr:hypothetical protein L483_14440 [Pseudomonas putida H8234]
MIIIEMGWNQKAFQKKTMMVFALAFIQSLPQNK